MLLECYKWTFKPCGSIFSPQVDHAIPLHSSMGLKSRIIVMKLTLGTDKQLYVYLTLFHIVLNGMYKNGCKSYD